MELRNYLTRFSNPCPHNQDQEHYRLIRDIKLDPTRVGMPSKVKIFREVSLPDNSGRVDLAAMSQEGLFYFIEGKIVNPLTWSMSQIVSRARKAKQHINTQLENASDFFIQEFGAIPILIGAYLSPFSRGIVHYRLAT